MKKSTGNDFQVSDQSLKPRRSKSREISSRYLSSTSPSHDSNGLPSPTQASSPLRRKSVSGTGKNQSLEDTAMLRGLWPSAIASQFPSNKKNLDTLADHLGNDRLRDFLESKKHKNPVESNNVFSLSRQRSCSELKRSEDAIEKENTREHGNMKRILGGSMRYTGKLRFPGKSSPSSSSSSSNLSAENPSFVPGRLSVDENALYRNSRLSSVVSDNLDLESENSDSSSQNSNRKVSLKHIGLDRPIRARIGTSNSNVSLDSSPKLRKFTLKNAIKRANSLTGYGSATSQWALSPGRTGSPPMTVESKERPMSFSSLKPPSSPSKSSPKGVEKLLNMGLELFKGKKSSSSRISQTGSRNVEDIHQLKLSHNRMLQWRYANARADSVNANVNKQAEINLVYAWHTLVNLRNSVILKKLQFQKEKLQMRLNFILRSQIKPLEAWGNMERQHLSTVTMMKDCLHSVVCKVPLIEGAEADPNKASVSLRHASDLALSIGKHLECYQDEEVVALVSELAEVVAQERLLLEECRELLQSISVMEIHEWSLKCNLIQLNVEYNKHLEK